MNNKLIFFLLTLISSQVIADTQSTQKTATPKNLNPQENKLEKITFQDQAILPVPATSSGSLESGFTAFVKAHPYKTAAAVTASVVVVAGVIYVVKKYKAKQIKKALFGLKLRIMRAVS